MFLDKLLKKPEPEQEVHHIKDEEPILVDDPNTLIITGDYAHWYMLYGKIMSLRNCCRSPISYEPPRRAICI